MKYCPACKEDKPETEFYTEKGRAGDGLSSNCKECKQARNRAYWKERYYPVHKEQQKEAVITRRKIAYPKLETENQKDARFARDLIKHLPD